MLLDECPHRVALTVERRPANAFCLEVGAPLPRCKLKPPEHWGSAAPSAARWLLSGGNPLVLGNCDAACPLLAKDEVGLVCAAIEAGAVVHAEHPDFGGTLTAGQYRTADCRSCWATIHHGGSCDVGLDAETAIELARSFVFQVGRRRAADAARLALAKLT